MYSVVSLKYDKNYIFKFFCLSLSSLDPPRGCSSYYQMTSNRTIRRMRFTVRILERPEVKLYL